MNKKCLGCGLTLQNTSETSLGYTPDLNNTYCKRCFRLKNYGEKKNENIIDNKELLKRINKRKGVVFFLIDYLNINKETINYFQEINLPKALIISKCDILRKDIKFSKIKLWLKKVYNITSEIFLESGITNYLNVNIFKFTKSLGYNTCYIMYHRNRITGSIYYRKYYFCNYIYFLC